MSDESAFAGVSPQIRAALLRRGFQSLTQVQEAVLAEDTQGRDLRISSKTGSGKTVALGLAVAPTLEALDPDRVGPVALVLAPTRELAGQVRQELATLYEDLDGVEVLVVTGGTDPVREKRALKNRPAVLVATPGRLLDHVRGGLDLSGVKQAVLDEADQMLDLGFREELEAVLEELSDERQLHMVSATFAREVLRFADKVQKDALHVEGSRLGEANEDIQHLAHIVLPNERHGALVNLLLADDDGSWLIFVRRRADAADLAELLVEDGFSAMPFSGDLSQPQRERTLSAFKRGLVKCLVATDVAARGIDVQDISTVVHFDLPTDVETFTHRSGRTGRAGQKGRSILVIPPSAERRTRRLLKDAKVEASWQSVPDAKKIEKAALKKARRALHARLDAGEELANKQLEYAQALLEKHDPATVVAVLLEMSRPPLPSEPVDIRELEPRGEDARGGGGYEKRSYGRGRSRGPQHNGDRGYGEGERRGPRPTGRRGKPDGAKGGRRPRGARS